MFKKKPLKAILPLAFILLPTANHAATLFESSVPGGEYSSSVTTPTTVDGTYDTVSGTGNAGQFDLFVFTGLISGAQTLTFNFAAPSGIPASYSAGGVLRYSTTPFVGNAWSGGADFAYPNVNISSPTDTGVLSLGTGFAGPLYLAMNFTYGSNLGYTISIDSAPSTVPVPAAGLLLVSVLGGLGLMARRRRRQTTA